MLICFLEVIKHNPNTDEFDYRQYECNFMMQIYRRNSRKRNGCI